MAEMGGASLTWNGAEIEAKVKAVALKHIDQTLAKAVEHARSNAPVLSGWLASNIRAEKATGSDTEVSGRFGTFAHSSPTGQNYTLFQEFGTRSVTGKHFLRRAFDATKGELKGMRL